MSGDELSKVEREAMVAAWDKRGIPPDDPAGPWCINASLRARFEAGFSAARDYYEHSGLDVANREIETLCQREAQAEKRERALREALTEIAGDYGCGLIEPPDVSLPPEGDPCRERRPDEPETWCVLCVASAALAASPQSDHPTDDVVTREQVENLDELLVTPVVDEDVPQSDHGPGEARLQAVVDFLDAWRFCPVATSPKPSRQCLENSAQQLLDALERDA